MPISCKYPIRRLSQREFGDISYEVMGHIFAVHNELGRLFDEEIYQKEIARRISSATTEVPIEVSFGGFDRTFFLDLLVDGGAIFELKAVDVLVPRHVAQLLNYLLLTDSGHGKIVNMRPEEVEHEFVNTSLRREDRVSFEIQDTGWREADGADFKEWFIAVLRDWGVGLDISLYEAVVKHRFNPNDVFPKSGIRGSDGELIGYQGTLNLAPDVAIRVTAVAEDRLPAFEQHLSCFLRHSSLRVLQWVNMTRRAVQFKTIDRSSLLI
jgi:GxxExxY protein